MVALLDANLLIALFDAAHVQHQPSHRWFSQNRAQGWATCPLTQNACIRILSQPAYPGRLPVADVARRLRQATAVADHQFWPDVIGPCDASLFDHGRILTPKHLTDVYLLALAVHAGGRLVTWDRSIPVAAVRGALPEHLLIL